MSQIVESLFGVSPERYQQQKDAALQQEAIAYALADPLQRATAGIYAGARQLGGGIGRMFGGEDPGMRRVTEQDQIIRSIDLNNPETFGPAAQRAYQMGHTELAQKIMLGADTAYQRQEAARQRAAQMQSRQQTQDAQQLIPRLMTPGQQSQMMVDAEGGSYMQEGQAAGIDQNTLRQLMATPAGRAELADYLKLQEATRGKRTTIGEGNTVIEEDPFTGAVRIVATGAVKPVVPPSYGAEFNRVAEEMYRGVPLNQLTGPQFAAINKRVDAVRASTAPKFSVDLSDPTAAAKARLDVITKWEGVLKSGGDVELSNRYNALQSSVALANKGNAVADGATIYNLAKMYDPSGAVQEGDKKSVVGNPSVPDRVKLLLQQLSVGGSFTPEQRKNMLKIADELVQQRENALQRQAKNYTDIVKTFGGTAEDIYSPYKNPAKQITLDDIITPMPAAAQVTTAAPPPAPPPAAPSGIAASLSGPLVGAPIVEPNIKATALPNKVAIDAVAKQAAEANLEPAAAPPTLFRPPAAKSAEGNRVTISSTRQETAIYNSLDPERSANGDVDVKRGNKRVIIGNTTDDISAVKLVYEYIRKNNLATKGK